MFLHRFITSPTSILGLGGIGFRGSGTGELGSETGFEAVLFLAA